jgi:hypothetical protein
MQALHDELDSVFEQYQANMGAFVEALADGAPLLRYYPVISNYFVVFDSNAFLIGRVEDNDLRKLLVWTYVRAKALMDSFRMNNEILARYENWLALAAQTGSPIHQQYVQGTYDGLVQYARGIKTSHVELKKSVAQLMRMLHKQGVLHEA